MLNEAFQYVITAKLSDTVKRPFFEYNECRYVSWQSTRSSIGPENILRCRSLSKENINFCGEESYI